MSRHQDHMDAAYTRWAEAGNISREEFFDLLGAEERFAVATGNLNYQVENGGWEQWVGNGYATPETVAYLRRQLPKTGPVAAQVLALMDEALPLAEEANEALCYEEDAGSERGRLDELSTAFYAINAAFLAEVEQRLVDWNKVRPWTPSAEFAEQEAREADDRRQVAEQFGG